MNNEYINEVLDDMNNCVSPCTDIPQTCPPNGGQVVNISWLVENLPGMNYIKNRALNYIFSNGMTAGGKDDDERLDHWLYDQSNDVGSANYLVLREAIGYAIMFGECGLRLYNGNLYKYEKGHFGILYEKAEGVQHIVGYFVDEEGKEISGDIDQEEWETWNSIEDIYTWFKEKKLILLDPSEFTNLRNETAYGPGRIILRAKSMDDTDGEETSTTSEILNNSGPAKEARFAKAKLEGERVARNIKSSSSDQVIVLSDGFKDEIEHLPRVTKATEFMTWLEGEGTIMAQILGMSSVLVEVGKWSGNVSMEKVIDDAMVNTIVPLREMYAVQFSPMISKHLGVGKVYFDKYDMKQAEDENVARQKIAAVIRDLALSAKNIQAAASETEGEQTSFKESLDNINRLVNEVSEVLRNSLYDENNEIRSLAVKPESYSIRKFG